MSGHIDAIRATAQAEAERRWPDRMGREDDDSPFMLDFSEERANFVENAMWLVSRLTRENIAKAVRDIKYGNDCADLTCEESVNDHADDISGAVLALLDG